LKQTGITMMKSMSLFAAIFMFATAGAGSAQDAEAGKAVFKKCVACHQIGPDAKNKVGPVLTDVVGRAAGSIQDFKYGKSLIAVGEKGLVWSEETLAAYLENPTNYLQTYLDDPKARSSMSFKLKKEEDRLNVAAYLTTVGSDETAAEEPDTAVETRTVEEVIADQVFTEEFMSDPANFAAGKELWFAQCTHCHGFKAYPGKAPKLKPAKYKPEFVFKRIYKGFKKMPAWNDVYTIDEIRQIVVYVKGQGFAP
jgi:cytochrome c